VSTEIEQQTPVHVATLDKVRALEAVMRRMPDQYTEGELTSHHFCQGLYFREFFLPAGCVAVCMQHARESFFLLIQGTAVFSTADGSVHRVVAPYMAVTQPGSKRVVAAETDTIFLTFHPNPDNERDLEILEARYIIPEALPAPEPQELLE